MTNVRCTVRRHNNPLVWVMLIVLIWYAYPAFMEKEKVSDHNSSPE